MARVWTHGRWTVKPGREDDFVAAWTRLAEAVGELGAAPPSFEPATLDEVAWSG